MRKFIIFYFEKKKYTFIVFKFPSHSFTMFCNGSFQGFEDPKNNGMNGLIGYLESMMQFEPNQNM